MISTENDLLSPGFNSQDIQAYMISTLLWCMLYVVSLYLPIPLKDRYRKLPTADELDLRNRQISFVHGISVLFLTTYAILYLPGSCMSPNSDLENLAMYSSMGYFTYDFLAMAYYSKHHTTY